MMSERKPSNGAKQRVSLGFVLMLMMSSLGMMATMPSASASVSGSLGLTDSTSPVEDSWYSSFDTLTFTVEVTNNYATSSGSARSLSWFACEGDIDAATCKSTYSDTGFFTLGNIPGTSSTNITSSSQWIPGQNAEGIFTILYAFAQNDQVASDDQFLFNINLTNEFVDIIVDTDHDPLETIDNLATFDGQQVLNTGTDYTFKSKGESTLCQVCAFSGEFGWQLWNMDDTIMLKEAYKTVSNLPAWGGYDPFNINLPAFNYGQQGHYILKYGLFSSTGNPYADLNDNNNLATFHIVLNDSIDLKVTDVYPSHGQQSQVFYYGTDRVVSTVANLGNMTVYNISAAFEVYNQQYELEVQNNCNIDVLHPASSATCTFNMTTTGQSRLLRVQLPNIFQSGEDVRKGDNLYQLTSDVEVGAINPYVQTNSDNNFYLTSDDVELVGRFSSIASQPLNYTWREGFYVWGYGQVLNLTGEEFGLGHHNLSLQVSDPWGNTEYNHVEFDILNAVDLSVPPYYTGSATTEQEATYTHDILLPYLGTSYGIGGGKSPLMMINIDVDGEDEEDVGLRGIELELNLSTILPSNIDPATVELRYLPTTESQIWTYIEGQESYTFSQDGTNVSVSLTKDGVILLIGVLPNTNVSAVDLEWTQLQGGSIQLDWAAVGDITNPYVGGWNIYKIEGISGTTVFPDPAGVVSENTWEELTQTTLVDTVNLENTSWVDPSSLETGICASYAIAPIDREGNPNFERINITRVNGAAGLLCGDAIPPSTTIASFTHSWVFTNSTDCFERQKDWSMCYNATLTWTWPDHEPQGNLSWNLYRTEFAPSNVDLKFIDPVVEGLMGTPGEQGTYLDSGLDMNGVRPYRTYYYILAPIDSVGNELMEANYPSPNIERVYIDDDWWTYNQHHIPAEPEPPEPPLGIPWLQKLNDATQVSEFQVSGIVLLAVLVMNFILLPLILRKRKRLKRVLEARKRNTVDTTEFDDFFE